MSRLPALADKLPTGVGYADGPADLIVAVLDRDRRILAYSPVLVNEPAFFDGVPGWDIHTGQMTVRQKGVPYAWVLIGRDAEGRAATFHPPVAVKRPWTKVRPGDEIMFDHLRVTLSHSVDEDPYA